VVDLDLGIKANVTRARYIIWDNVVGFSREEDTCSLSVLFHA